MSAESRTPRWAPETDLQWGLCHLDRHQEKTTETSGALQSDFDAVGTNYWFVWPEGNCPPDWAWFLPRFFFSVLSPMEFWFLAVVASGLLSWGHFISSNIMTWLHRYYLNWTELDNDITEFNNEMPLTQTFSCFDIVQLLWHNLYC